MLMGEGTIARATVSDSAGSEMVPSIQYGRDVTCCKRRASGMECPHAARMGRNYRQGRSIDSCEWGRSSLSGGEAANIFDS